MRTLHPVALSGYTTLGLGGPAGRFAEAQTEHELVAEIRAADARGVPLLVLGGGSNLVISDDGFPGTVVRVATPGMRISSGAQVRVAAGEDWDGVVQRCIAGELSGVECLSGIPGLTGATPIQNVGAYGQEVSETIVAVRAYDRERGEVVQLSNADCGFGYRTSAFKRSLAAAGSPATAFIAGRAAFPPAAGRAAFPPATGRFVVLEVTFRLRRDPLSRPVRYAELASALGVPLGGRAPLAEVREAVLALRRRKGMVLDPADPDTRSAGSFFTNPVLDAERYAGLERTVAQMFGPGTVIPSFPAGGGRIKVPAAWLIERAGFGKGYDPGTGPRISSKHTLALINPDGVSSTAALIRLAADIRGSVARTFGIELVPEPVLVGVRL
jgi:UDP-N-acetylmuramate dehydrogenase